MYCFESRNRRAPIRQQPHTRPPFPLRPFGWAGLKCFTAAQRATSHAPFPSPPRLSVRWFEVAPSWRPHIRLVAASCHSTPTPASQPAQPDGLPSPDHLPSADSCSALRAAAAVRTRTATLLASLATVDQRRTKTAAGSADGVSAIGPRSSPLSFGRKHRTPPCVSAHWHGTANEWRTSGNSHDCDADISR